MEIFYSSDIDGNSVRLDAEESQHCAKVMRKHAGDTINVIDGHGTLHKCVISVDNPKRVEAVVQESIGGWGSHPYSLALAVCPTKNNERYEWFAEKATEFGVDTIVPAIGERSQRRVFKTERLRRVVLSATKQSLKGKLPEVAEPLSVSEFISSCPASCKMIACCFDGDEGARRPIGAVLSEAEEPDYAVLIGPEGDFSPDEVRLAMSKGFIPVHLGSSRLRTETAGVAAAAAVYFHHIEN